MSEVELLRPQAISYDVDGNLLSYFDPWAERANAAWGDLTALYNDALGGSVMPVLLDAVSRGDKQATRQLKAIYEADLDALMFAVRRGDEAIEKKPHVLAALDKRADGNPGLVTTNLVKAAQEGADAAAIDAAEKAFRDHVGRRIDGLLEGYRQGDKEAAKTLTDLALMDRPVLAKDAARNNYAAFHSLQALVEEAGVPRARREAIAYAWDEDPDAGRQRDLFCRKERDIVLTFRAERDASSRLYENVAEVLAAVHAMGSVQIIDTDARFEDLAERLFLAGVDLDQIDGVICKIDKGEGTPEREPPLGADSPMARYRRAMWDKTLAFTTESKGTQARADIALKAYARFGVDPSAVLHTGDTVKDGLHAKMAGTLFALNHEGADVTAQTAELNEMLNPFYPLGLAVTKAEIAKADVAVHADMPNGFRDFDGLVAPQRRPAAPAGPAMNRPRRSITANSRVSGPAPV